MTPKECYLKWGDPFTTNDEGNYMVLWDVPTELEIGVIPKKIYCNKVMISPLTMAFKNLIERGFVKELKTWDGCFLVRIQRGYENAYKRAKNAGNIEQAIKYISIHSWGCAIDLNQAWNQLGKTPTLSAGFVKCFTDSGFIWGGNFSRKDGMHFELRSI